MTKKRISAKQLISIRNILPFAVLIVLLFNVFLLLSLARTVSDKAAAAAEAARPADVQLLLVKDDACEGCTDITPLVEAVKKENVNVLAERVIDFSSAEGKGLVDEYAINRLPALIIKGETDKGLPYEEGLDKRAGALVFDATPAPYLDVKTMRLVGDVKATILLDESCVDCPNLTMLVDQLTQLNVRISSTTSVDYKSKRGARIVKAYGIKRAPALLLSKDAEAYDLVKEAWPQVGTIESDGTFVTRNLGPPYVNLENGVVRGVVSVTLLDDVSCEGCYDVNIHKQILAGAGIDAFDAEAVDVASEEGKQLVETYAITAVPTVLISGDTKEYTSLVAAWEKVGTIEDDGTMVFRDPTVIKAVYRNLTTGELVGEPSGE